MRDESEDERDWPPFQSDVDQGFTALAEKHSNALFIVKLQEILKTPHTTASIIMSDVADIVHRSVSKVEDKVVDVLNRNGIDPENVDGLHSVFQKPDLLNPFNGLGLIRFIDKESTLKITLD